MQSKSVSHRQIDMSNHPTTIEDEPARELWERLAEGEKIGDISEHLGYGLKYGCRLAAQAASKEIAAGTTYEVCANLFGEHEAACWMQIEKRLEGEILAKASHARRIWLLTRMQSLHSAGMSVTDIAGSLGMPEAEVNRDIRAAIIVSYRLHGDTLESIAAKVDLTRERVRQILKDFGIDAKFLAERAAANIAEVNEVYVAIGQWVLEHPGCTPSEIAGAFGIPDSEIAEMIPSGAAHLVLDSRFEPVPGAEEVRKASKSRIMQAIRHAATIQNEKTGPEQSETLYLTGPRYTSLQKQGLIDGPTLPRILQVFGTWRNACDNAGVSCDEPVHETYERRWTRVEMSRSVAEFLMTEGQHGVSKYDNWARKDDARPGFGTVRNEFGGWKVAYEEALRLLRSDWIMWQRGKQANT